MLMTWSGALIYWANDIYRIGIGKITLFHFFPDGFYRLVHIDHRLAEGMAWHFTLAWLFSMTGILYVFYLIFSGEWRELVPRATSWRDAWGVALHDLGLRADAPPHGKLNAAQRIAYTAVILMGAGSVTTGLAIYKPVQLSWITTACGGYEAARFEHFWLTIGYLVFLGVHVAQVMRAGWNNFRAMVAGFEVVETPKKDGPK